MKSQRLVAGFAGVFGKTLISMSILPLILLFTEPIEAKKGSAIDENPIQVVLLADSETPYVSGQPLQISLHLGDDMNGFKNLLGLGFALNYDKEVFTLEGYELLDSFTGTASEEEILIFTQTSDPDSDSFSFVRIAEVGGISGVGEIIRFLFTVNNDLTVDLAEISLSLVEILNESGILLESEVSGVSLDLIPFPVWPGDTNNDGVVDILDVLPLGLYYGETGTPRASSSVQWQPQASTPFNVIEASYADAIGDGVVNQNDLLPVGLNFGKSIPWLSNSEASKSRMLKEFASIELPIGENGDRHWIRVSSEDAIAVLGVAAELGVNPNLYSITSIVVPSELAVPNVIKLEKKPTASIPIHSYAVTRTAPMGTAILKESLVAVEITYLADIEEGTSITLRKFAITSSDGLIYPELKVSKSWITSIGTPDTPLRFELAQNFPNPFNPGTFIRFSLPESAAVSLEVYNTLGQLVAVVASGEMSAGMHSAYFDASNLSSGVYVYRLQAGDQVISRKMLLMK